MLKTYWEDLTEEQKIDFFNFYMEVTFNGAIACYACPNPKNGRGVTSDDSMCENLFRYKALFGCPCSTFGLEAFEALERTLREEGWIE